MIFSACFLFWIPYAWAFPHYAAHASTGNSTGGGMGSHGGPLTPKHFTWKAPGPGDVRAPCPVMNTLANHGFVNHNGRNITRAPFVKAVMDAFNLSEEFANGIFTNGIPSNPTPNATFFDLDMLHNTHGLIEHDGSLSRKDIFLDPSNRFDEETFNSLLSFLPKTGTFNVSDLANARARHAFNMSLTNPTFEITQSAIPVIMGENAMMLSIFGNPDTAIANRAFFEFFFRYERLPVILGWTPSTTQIGANVGKIVEDLIALSPSDVPLTFSPEATTA